jgi:hypothetical protein
MSTAYLLTHSTTGAIVTRSDVRRYVAASLGVTPFEVSAECLLDADDSVFFRVQLPSGADPRSFPVLLTPIPNDLPSTLLRSTLPHCADALSWLRGCRSTPNRSTFQLGRPLIVSANSVPGRVAINMLSPDDWRVYRFASSAHRDRAYRRFRFAQDWLAAAAADLGFTVTRRRGSPTLMAIGRAASQ